MRNPFIFLLSFLMALPLQPLQAASRKEDPVEAVLAHHLYDYRLVGTTDEFIEKFAKHMVPEDRKYLEKVLAGTKKLPEVRRVGTVAVFTIEGQTLQVDFRYFAQNIVYFNGHRYYWSLGLPLRNHVERLTKILNKGEGFSWFRLFVPEAQAGIFIPILIGAGATAGTAIIGALTSSAISHYEIWKKVDYSICESKINGGDKDYQDAPMCAEYMELQRKKLQKNPELTAAKVALTDQAEDPIETTNEFCPHHGDGDDKGRAYRATFLLVKEKKRVRVKSEIIDKKLKIEVRDFISGEIVATYMVNVDNELEEIIIPNPKASGDKVAPSEIKIQAASNPSDPEIAAQLALHRRIFKRFGVRLTSCKAEKAEIDAARAKVNAYPESTKPGRR